MKTTYEYEGEVFTKDVLVNEFKCSENYAEILLERLDWQHPATVIDEDFMYGETEEVDGYISIKKTLD